MRSRPVEMSAPHSLGRDTMPLNPHLHLESQVEAQTGMRSTPPEMSLLHSPGCNCTSLKPKA